MRACAILAIASIQNGQTKWMHQYAGIYHTLAGMEGLHDEKLWPKQLNPIEIEERRRLVWICQPEFSLTFIAIELYCLPLY